MKSTINLQRGAKPVYLIVAIAVAAVAARRRLLGRHAQGEPGNCGRGRDACGECRRRRQRTHRRIGAPRALLARPDGPGAEIRQAWQEPLHGHGPRARLRGRRRRRRQGDHQPAAHAELRRAHGRSKGRFARDRLHRRRRDRRRRARASSPCSRGRRATSSGSTCARRTTASRAGSRSPICTCRSGSPRRKNGSRSRRARSPASPALADAARERLRLLGMPDAEIARVEREGKPRHG